MSCDVKTPHAGAEGMLLQKGKIQFIRAVQDKRRTL